MQVQASHSQALHLAPPPPPYTPLHDPPPLHTHHPCRAKEPWEATDGALYMLRELSHVRPQVGREGQGAGGWNVVCRRVGRHSERGRGMWRVQSSERVKGLRV